MREANLDLSLVVPVHNGAHLLEGTVQTLLDAAGQLRKSFELIVVDDGSTDGTGLCLKGLQRADPRVRGITLPRPEGRGAALQQGVLAAEGRVIATWDADLATGADALPRALGLIDRGAAIVIGDRRNGDSVVEPPRWPFTQALGDLFNLMARVLVWPAVGDFTCGFRAYRRDAARDLFESLDLSSAASDVELLALARQRALRVEGIPVCWSRRARALVWGRGERLRGFLDLLTVFGRRLAGSYR